MSSELSSPRSCEDFQTVWKIRKRSWRKIRKEKFQLHPKAMLQHTVVVVEGDSNNSKTEISIMFDLNPIYQFTPSKMRKKEGKR